MYVICMVNFYEQLRISLLLESQVKYILCSRLIFSMMMSLNFSFSKTFFYRKKVCRITNRFIIYFTSKQTKIDRNSSSHSI